MTLNKNQKKLCKEIGEEIAHLLFDKYGNALKCLLTEDSKTSQSEPHRKATVNDNSLTVKGCGQEYLTKLGYVICSGAELLCPKCQQSAQDVPFSKKMGDNSNECQQSSGDAPELYEQIKEKEKEIEELRKKANHWTMKEVPTTQEKRNPENFDDGITHVAPKGEYKPSTKEQIKKEIDKDYGN